MQEDQRLRETERVVRRIMKKVRKYDQVGKAEFEEILGRVMDEVHGNTEVAMDRIADVTDIVIGDFPREYGQIDESHRSWEAMIGYLYCKYLKELDAL